ncbi:branched-chain amino acid aminotransferase [Bacillus sp. T3]|uniref:branched-chain amino acid aminotransferase n=1 Tax=Bacillus sp. T3 TaxID=467262 RepID=UPI002980B4A8|nr:branched-chain amino acid aminotransferase [Bacillus sp. T3]
MVPDFNDAYIERLDKETEEVLGKETASFLEQHITYFKNHLNEFMYLESPAFEQKNVDAVSFEVDDVFRTYTVLLGLKLQKKYQPTIKEFLNANLRGEDAQVSLMFNGDDGLWDLNLSLDHVEGFREEMTIGEAYQLVYDLIAKLVGSIK